MTLGNSPLSALLTSQQGVTSWGIAPLSYIGDQPLTRALRRLRVVLVPEPEDEDRSGVARSLAGVEVRRSESPLRAKVPAPSGFVSRFFRIRLVDEALLAQSRVLRTIKQVPQIVPEPLGFGTDQGRGCLTSFPLTHCPFRPLAHPNSDYGNRKTLTGTSTFGRVRGISPRHSGSCTGLPVTDCARGSEVHVSGPRHLSPNRQTASTPPLLAAQQSWGH